MTVVEIRPRRDGIVSRVSVQVSEYSAANGGMDQGAIYAVEVLFPDGTWNVASHHEALDEAWIEAAVEANARKALLLPESVWPSRKVSI